MSLTWSNVQRPNKIIGSAHCWADTPFGRFLLVHQGESFSFELTPWGLDADGMDFKSIAEAQQWAESEYQKRCKAGPIQPRPLIPPGAPEVNTLSYTAEQQAAIDDCARTMGVTEADLVRIAVLDYIKAQLGDRTL